MEQKNESELSPAMQKVLSASGCLFAAFYWLNLYAFLSLFFGIIFPGFGKGDFGHYLRLALILAIMFSVGENIRKKQSPLLILSFTALLFVVNAIAIWRNWFWH
jgi:hypothetical protein